MNCYALISGYVCGVHPQNAGALGAGATCAGTKGRRQIRHKYWRFINLWMEVVFYTLSMTIIFAFVEPGSIGPKEIGNALFPLLSKQYWYFNVYFVLYLFMPFVDRLIEVLDKKEM